MIFWACIAYILGICLFFDFWAWRPQGLLVIFFESGVDIFRCIGGLMLKKLKTSLDGAVNCT